MCGIADADQADHVKPISKGGAHCLANLRPICNFWSSSKGGRWPVPAEVLQPRFRHPRPQPGSAIDLVTPRRPRVDWMCPQCLETFSLRACDADKEVLLAPLSDRRARHHDHRPDVPQPPLQPQLHAARP